MAKDTEQIKLETDVLVVGGAWQATMGQSGSRKRRQGLNR